MRSRFPALLSLAQSFAPRRAGRGVPQAARSGPGSCPGRRGGVLLLVLLLAAACAPTSAPPTAEPSPLPVVRLTAATVPGAETRLRAWVGRYEKNHPGVVVEVRSDTLARVQELVAGGSVDIAALDQEPLPYYEGVLTGTVVADEPVAVVIHAGKGVDSLSGAVLTQLLAGRVGDWAEIGGPAGPVQVYLLPESSGVVRYLEDAVMAGERLAPQAIVCASALSLLRAVAADPGGIGVVPFSALTGQGHVLGVEGRFPQDADYPWRMPLFLGYGPAAPLPAREFVQYIDRQD